MALSVRPPVAPMLARLADEVPETGHLYELADPASLVFTIADVLARVRERGDLWAGTTERRQVLPAL